MQLMSRFGICYLSTHWLYYGYQSINQSVSLFVTRHADAGMANHRRGRAMISDGTTDER